MFDVENITNVEMREVAYAFPVHINDELSGLGMTLRDYFAAKAMQPLTSGARDYRKAEAIDMARGAYMIADAMLKAREE